MQKINPGALRKLRTNKGWSQEELAEKSKIDKQTISRLERGENEAARNRTIEQLARTLNADKSVLLGNTPAPDAETRSFRSHLKIPMGTEQRNAMHLVAMRYFVRPHQIIELAPLLFCWAAEASLRKRRERIDDVEVAHANTREALRATQHLGNFGADDYDAAIQKERESIDSQDIFGMSVLQDPELPTPDPDAETPFESFLRSLAADFRKVISFERFDFLDSPEYHLCREEALRLVGGDAELAAFILKGYVSLHELPDELHHSEVGVTEQRAEWVRVKAKEFHDEIMKSIASRPSIRRVK